MTLVRLHETGLQTVILRTAGMLMWRAAFLGTALYLVLGSDPAANLKFNGVSYIVASVWPYYDGVLDRWMWSLAFVEAAFLHLLGAPVGNNLLAVVFGNPVLGT